NVVQLAVEVRDRWVEQHGDQRSGRHHFAQQREALAFHCGEQHVYAGGVTAWLVEACDKTLPHRVGAAGKDNRDCCGRRLCGPARGIASSRHDHRHPTADQLGGEHWQPVVLALRPPKFNRDVLTLDEIGLTEAAPKRLHKTPPGSGRRAVEKPDHRHRRLLCPRRERPRGRAAEQTDELAPLHVWMAPAWQEKIERAAQKSLAVMCPACSRSPDGLLALMGSANRGLITRTGSMSQ